MNEYYWALFTVLIAGGLAAGGAVLFVKGFKIGYKKGLEQEPDSGWINYIPKEQYKAIVPGKDKEYV